MLLSINTYNYQSPSSSVNGLPRLPTIYKQRQKRQHDLDNLLDIEEEESRSNKRRKSAKRKSNPKIKTFATTIPADEEEAFGQDNENLSPELRIKYRRLLLEYRLQFLRHFKLDRHSLLAHTFGSHYSKHNDGIKDGIDRISHHSVNWKRRIIEKMQKQVTQIMAETKRTELLDKDSPVALLARNLKSEFSMLRFERIFDFASESISLEASADGSRKCLWYFRRKLSAVCCLLSAICCWLSAVGCLLSAVYTNFNLLQNFGVTSQHASS